jgi:multiple sugar transport system permease protein
MATLEVDTIEDVESVESLAPGPVKRPSRSKDFRRTLLMWLLLLPLVFVVLVPIVYMITMAFTPESKQLNFPIEWIPQPPTLGNFQRIFADATLPIGRWFINSLIVSVVGTALIVFFSSLSGYAFARLDFPGKNVIFSILIFSLMIPAAITLIPVFLLLRDFELLNTYAAIWLPASASVLGIFLMRQHFYAIPSDIEDAATMDGAGRFRIFWQVCLPMVRGSMVAVAIFSFLLLWNDLFWPLIVLSDRDMLTLPVGLLVIQQGSYIQRGLAFAGAFIATIPPLIFYAIFQRKIIAGITTTGMAGQ